MGLGKKDGDGGSAERKKRGEKYERERRGEKRRHRDQRKERV